MGTAYYGIFGDYPLGVIDHLNEEANQWSKFEWKIKNIDSKKVLKEIKLQTIKKRDAAQMLLDYTMKSYETRVRRSNSIVDPANMEDWEKVVQMIHSFIIN